MTHEGFQAILIGDAVDQTKPVVEHGFGRIPPSVIDERENNGFIQGR